MAELRDFEQEIIESFKLFGGGKAKPRLGIWIRGRLSDIGEHYPYSLWQEWITFCEQARGEGANIPRNNYTQFVIYVRCLELAGLVRVVREEPYRLEGAPGEIKYRYYGVVETKVKSSLWNNPRKGSPNYSKWRELLEKRRKEYIERRLIKKRALLPEGVTPRRGRPSRLSQT